MSTARRATTLRQRAYAKLTLSLRVTGVRDDGFHELDALTVAAADLYDDVRIAPDPHRSTCTITPSGAAPAGPTNLAAGALRSIVALLPADARHWRINIVKRLPTGAGIGGGSADAAAVLRAFRRHYALRDRDVLAAAARLGSDVPFCVESRAAWMRGRGERVVRLPAAGRLDVVVVTPAFACSTPDVYRAWDALGGPVADRRVPAPPGWADVLPALANDLEPAAEHVEPRLVAFRERLASATGIEPILMGSGSSYALVCSADPDGVASAAAAAVPDARLVARTVIR